jgi:hypothetical protein
MQAKIRELYKASQQSQQAEMQGSGQNPLGYNGMQHCAMNLMAAGGAYAGSGSAAAMTGTMGYPQPGAEPPRLQPQRHERQDPLHAYASM